MAKLLMRLSGVPEDELIDVCRLLEESDIGFYQTSAGFWGIGVAGLWLSDDHQYESAKELLGAYQRDRYEREKDAPVESFIERFFRQPIRALLALSAVAAIVYISVVPFVDMLG